MSNLNRHIWEGWTAQDFVDDLLPMIKYQKFNSDDKLKKWCKENQPYYKKHIPEVYSYFKNYLKENK